MRGEVKRRIENLEARLRSYREYARGVTEQTSEFAEENQELLMLLLDHLGLSIHLVEEHYELVPREEEP